MHRPLTARRGPRRGRPAVPVLALLAVAGGGQFLIAASAADAATGTASAVVVDSTMMRYWAASGQVNQVTVTSEFVSDYTVRYTIDDRVEITAGTGCTHPDPADLTLVTCDAQESPTSGGPTAAVRLGDRNDTLDLDAFAATGYGGSGRDTLTGGSRRVRLFGGDDADVLRGGTANDYLDGGSGPDRLYGGRSGDQLRGGSGDDVLYGNSSNDRLYGGRGNDRLYGGPGTDTLSGGPGHDLLHQD